MIRYIKLANDKKRDVEITFRFLNPHVYCISKTPQDSKLGRKIIQFSVEMINKIGFESFNFKKLATEINSTEASLYRYFENKHLLLLYLVNWTKSCKTGIGNGLIT